MSLALNRRRFTFLGSRLVLLVKLLNTARNRYRGDRGREKNRSHGHLAGVGVAGAGGGLSPLATTRKRKERSRPEYTR